MILQVFTVHDQKVGAYLPPFCLANKAQALRAFTDTCSDINHAFNKHPEDYTLFDLGTYDDSNAVFVSNVTPISLGTGLEHLTEVPTAIVPVPQKTNSQGAPKS